VPESARSFERTTITNMQENDAHPFCVEQGKNET
jgi:hypothetical protein